MDIGYWFKFPGLLTQVGVILLLVGGVLVVLRARQGYFLLALKQWVNLVKDVGAIIWLMCMIILLAVSSEPMTKFLLEVAAAEFPADGSAYWVLTRLVPQVYLLTGLVLLLLAVVKVWRWLPISYNERERALLNEEKAKWKQRLGVLGRFLLR